MKPTRIAALYDVHGNMPALKAALAAAADVSVELLVFGGDMALGPMPAEVLDLCMQLTTPARFLSGNCDRLVVDAFDGRALPAATPETARKSFEWVAGRLTQGHRDFLAGLPLSVSLDVPGLGEVLSCHATPRSDSEIITERTPESVLRPMLSHFGARVIVCGHTHIQYDREVDDTRIVNAGSVGMPYGATGAHWLLLDSDVHLHRTAYDTKAAAARIRASGYPDAESFITRHLVNPPTSDEMTHAFESGAERSRGNTTQLTWHIRAPRARVYAALLDATAVARWKVPDGMSATVHEFDPREGGRIRVSLHYHDPSAVGKSAAHTDTYTGRFTRLVPDTEVVEADTFETNDPSLQGEMITRIILHDAPGGTQLEATHSGVPAVVSPEDNETGWRMALTKLAAVVEG